jgi:TonB family protein
MRVPRREPEKARIEVIPMIDIIFFLLVFFMISTLSMTINRGLPVNLPKAASSPLPVEGGEAGAGKLFDKGDVGVVPGAGAGGGSGGPGRAGLGTGGPGAGGTHVAGLPPGAGLGGDSGVARPLGGYQVKPRYPESARRQGFEGTTLLKIHVSDTGRVEDVLVERSAGHEDLDFAAMEAVKPAGQAA